MTSVAHVHLALPSNRENVPLIRQAFSGFSEAIGLSTADTHDISTALAEACNNVSLHAYDEAEGPLEVNLRATARTVIVRVRDRGRGLGSADVRIEPRAAKGDRVAGIGLAAMRCLANSMRIRARPGGGTEVVMIFNTSPISAGVLGQPQECFEPRVSEPSQLASPIELDIAPLAVARRVIGRVLRFMASRAHFSIDELSDVQRVGEVLFATAPGWVRSGHVQAGVAAAAETLELGIGPMHVDDVALLASAVREIEPAVEPLLPLAQAKCDKQLMLRFRRAPLVRDAAQRRAG